MHMKMSVKYRLKSDYEKMTEVKNHTGRKSCPWLQMLLMHQDHKTSGSPEERTCRLQRADPDHWTTRMSLYNLHCPPAVQVPDVDGTLFRPAKPLKVFTLYAFLNSVVCVTAAQWRIRQDNISLSTQKNTKLLKSNVWKAGFSSSLCSTEPDKQSSHHTRQKEEIISFRNELKCWLAYPENSRGVSSPLHLKWRVLRALPAPLRV